MRTFIEAAVDDDSWFEYHEKFATSAVVGLARVAGIAVVVIANQRQVLGGSMTAASSSKVTRILKLANAYHLPVITLVDVPGFIATQAESVGQILSKGAGLLMTYPNLMVPRISVVIDKAFGGAYCAMDSYATSVRSGLYRHYGFTTGQIAVMGKEAGPFFTYGPDRGDAAVREQYQDRYENEYLNMNLAYEDRLVEPLEPEALRPCLVAELPPLYDAYQAYWQRLIRRPRSGTRGMPGPVYRIASRRPARPDSSPVTCDARRFSPMKISHAMPESVIPAYAGIQRP